ncbi:hypothetical protein J437_LFUL018296, partial [Ladona fulva]
MRKSRIVTEELKTLITKYKFDICLLQEPYTINNKIAGFSINSRILQCNNPNINPAAGILINNNDIEVMLIDKFTDSHCVCAEIYSHDLEPYLNKLSAIIKYFNNNNLLIAGDFNAQSKIWHDKLTDKTGEKLEEFIFDLNVLNTSTTIPTFHNTRGMSNIDFTLVNDKLIKNMKQWKIIGNVVTSDHNLIMFTFNAHTAKEKTISDNTRKYNLKKADWKKNLNTLKPVNIDITIDSQILTLENTIHESARKTIPIIRRNNNSKHIWWNTNLKKLKKEVIKLRRKVYKESRHNTNGHSTK